MLHFFEYGHLPQELQFVSRKFHELAHFIDKNLPATSERMVALRKLLEAKDAAVRSAVEKHSAKPRQMASGAQPASPHSRMGPKRGGAFANPKGKLKPKRAYTIQELASEFGLSTSSIYNEIRDGRLKAAKIGSRTLLGYDEVAAWWQTRVGQPLSPNNRGGKAGTYQRGDSGISEVLK